jgi:hypothetical protein
MSARDDHIAALTAERDALRAIVEPLLPIARLVATQDNRITAGPIFNVEEWRGIKGWVAVQPFFTEAGAQRFLDINGHNLAGGRGFIHAKKPPRIYAEGSFRNEEWRAVRAALLALAALEATAIPNRESSAVVDGGKDKIREPH